jgi:hypothetical protein
MKTVFVWARSRPASSHAVQMKPPAITLLLVFVLSVAGLLSSQATSQHYLDDIKALSSPEMEGRGDGTHGLTLAAQLIEKRYRSLGLEPAGSKSYFQPFTLVTGARLKGSNALEVKSGSEVTSLKLDQDFSPFSFSSSGSITAAAVFAGYGATAPEFGYDDYDHIDVKDKIVVVLRYEPPQFSKNRAGLTQHADLVTKAINARNHGARAMVVLNGNLPHGEEDLLVRFGSVNGPADTGVLLVQAKNEAAKKWF